MGSGVCHRARTVGTRRPPGRCTTSCVSNISGGRGGVRPTPATTRCGARVVSSGDPGPRGCSAISSRGEGNIGGIGRDSGTTIRGHRGSLRTKGTVHARTSTSGTLASDKGCGCSIRAIPSSDVSADATVKVSGPGF